MNSEPWLSLEEVINNQLKLQVDISYSRHYSFMLKHGLPVCKNVLDLGTGNGYFLSRAASNNPEIKFYGIDNKPHMISAAMKLDSGNVEWKTGDIHDFTTLPSFTHIDGILMRYFVLHLADVMEILTRIGRNVKKGTVLWIFDLDLNQFVCEPSQKAFDSIRNLVQRFCDHYSIDSKAASLLPDLLRDAGFDLLEKEVEPFSNRKVEKELFQKFLSQEVYLYSNFLGESQDTSEMESIKNFIRHQAISEDYMVQYGIVMIAAQKN
ncbi:MAG: class I SAM-dependent methyltransferase [Candidatus Eremiobacterota bacterium]